VQTPIAETNTPYKFIETTEPKRFNQQHPKKSPHQRSTRVTTRLLLDLTYGLRFPNAIGRPPPAIAPQSIGSNRRPIPTICAIVVTSGPTLQQRERMVSPPQTWKAEANTQDATQQRFSKVSNRAVPAGVCTPAVTSNQPSQNKHQSTTSKSNLHIGDPPESPRGCC
jgi:hypothetical protein